MSSKSAESGVADRTWPEFLALWEGFLRDSSELGTVIVVEGERDRASLRSLGIRGPIVLANRGLKLGALAQDLARTSRRVIVLTDWDESGGRLAQRLRDFLRADRPELDLDFRRRLALVLRGEVVHVEGLFGWARRMAERSGAPIEHFLAPGAANAVATRE